MVRLNIIEPEPSNRAFVRPGLLWPLFAQCIFLALIVSLSTLMGIFALKEGFWQFIATVRETERSGARAPRPGLPRRMSLAHHGSDSLVGADTPRHEATELPRAVDGEAVCWESCDNSSTAAVVSSWEHRVGLGQGESVTLHCHRPGY